MKQADLFNIEGHVALEEDAPLAEPEVVSSAATV